VEEWDGTSVKGTFYTQDLQKVTVEDDDLFHIDNIVKRKGDKVLVRWKGWAVKYDSWLHKKDVLVKKTKKREFYVQLLSNASTSEFPDNKANSFKFRLPYPLTFDADKEWEVGLVNVSYPIPPSRPHQVPVHQAHDFNNDDMFSVEWTIETFLRQSDRSWLPGRYRVPFHITGKELNRD